MLYLLGLFAAPADYATSTMNQGFSVGLDFMTWLLPFLIVMFGGLAVGLIVHAIKN